MARTESNEDMHVSIWPEWSFFDAETQLLADVIAKAQEAKPERVGILFPLLDSIRESSSTLELLVRRQSLRDSYVVSRVIYETSVNACFVLTDPVRLSGRANRHAKQKALRSLHRSINIAGSPLFDFKHQEADRLMAYPEHKLWLDEFTSSSDREITAWTPENVQQRLEAVHDTFGPDATSSLAFGLLLYRHASEIAHGTLYGTLFSWGALEVGQPLTSPSDLGCFRRAELRHLLKLVCFTLESLVRVTSVAVDAPELADQAATARRDFYASRTRAE